MAALAEAANRIKKYEAVLSPALQKALKVVGPPSRVAGSEREALLAASLLPGRPRRRAASLLVAAPHTAAGAKTSTAPCCRRCCMHCLRHSRAAKRRASSTSGSRKARASASGGCYPAAWGPRAVAPSLPIVMHVA